MSRTDAAPWRCGAEPGPGDAPGPGSVSRFVGWAKAHLRCAHHLSSDCVLNGGHAALCPPNDSIAPADPRRRRVAGATGPAIIDASSRTEKSHHHDPACFCPKAQLKRAQSLRTTKKCATFALLWGFRKPLREAAIRAAVDLPFEMRPFPANSKRRGCSSWRSLLFPARSIR
jgi:hypothetical protein